MKKRIAWNKGIKTGIVPKTAYKKGSIPWTTGKPRPIEVLNKISESKKKNPTRYWQGKKRLNISGSKCHLWKGGKPKCRVCEKQLSSYRAKYCREHFRMFQSGKNSPQWVNGNYKKCDERNDSAYQNWHKLVKKRDRNKCVFKGQHCSGYNIVHHILPWRDYPELRYEIKNGITLCQFHHPRKWDDERRLIPFFQGLVMSKTII